MPSGGLAAASVRWTHETGLTGHHESMANLKGIVSRLTSNRGGAGGAGATRSAGGGGRRGGGAGGGGNRSQDEAIGRGIRKVFKRLR